jgi:hypothetical protein
LIVFGIASLAYHEVTYTTKDKVAEIGPLAVTQDVEKTISFPPILSGLSIAVGITLIFIARIKK